MSYLIDTNIFIFMATRQKDSLSDGVQYIMAQPENVPCMSIESVRELIVMHNNDKMVVKLGKSAKEMIDNVKNEYNISVLPWKTEYLATYAELDINKHQDHNYLSDRIIIAHAITGNLPLISADRKFPYYRS